MRRALVVAWLVTMPIAFIASCLSFGDLSGGSGADASADTSQFSDVASNDTSAPPTDGAASDASDGGSILSCNADGLVGYWPMNEGLGTTVHDCHQGLDGVFVTDGGGPFWGTRGDGGDVEFTGGGFVQLGMPPQFQMSGAFTVAGWFRTDEAISGGYVSLFWNFDGDLGRGYEITLNDTNRLYAQLGLAAGPVNGFFATPTLGTWIHVAAVFTPNVELQIYLNGANVAITTTKEDGGAFPSGGVLPDDHGVQFGPVMNTSWLGAIDDVRLFSRALSASEIAALAQE